MATWMNEYEIVEAVRLFDNDDTLNLDRAARTLFSLMNWTDSNSDGWPYWAKPAKAATRLMDMMQPHLLAARFGYYPGTATRLHDVSDAELTAALRPIKAFLTRQGVSHTAVIG